MDVELQDSFEETPSIDDSNFRGPGSDIIDQATAEMAAEPAIKSSTTDDAARLSDEDNVCQSISIRVSSKHLTLASIVFKKMLDAGFKEGLELSSAGYVEIPMPETDPTAFLILLNIIHGRIKKVPRKVDLFLLTEIAVLVDRYELLEITELWSDQWLRDLEESVPVTLDEDLLPWMCISWVFKIPDIFKQITMVAHLESEGLLETTQLPIPESVLGMDSGYIATTRN